MGVWSPHYHQKVHFQWFISSNKLPIPTQLLSLPNSATSWRPRLQHMRLWGTLHIKTNTCSKQGSQAGHCPVWNDWHLVFVDLKGLPGSSSIFLPQMSLPAAVTRIWTSPKFLSSSTQLVALSRRFYRLREMEPAVGNRLLVAGPWAVVCNPCYFLSFLHSLFHVFAGVWCLG